MKTKRITNNVQLQAMRHEYNLVCDVSDKMQGLWFCSDRYEHLYNQIGKIQDSLFSELQAYEARYLAESKVESQLLTVK